MRIYLDVCCLNRPLDDPAIGRNRLESEAVLEILRRVRSGEWTLVGSEAVDAEIALMPSADRRGQVVALANLRSEVVAAGNAERGRATTLLALGYGYMDALHVACAESAGCQVLLTTDDRFLSKYRDHPDRIMVRMANPLVWIAEVSAP